MLTVAQWRTALQRHNSVASDLFKGDWEELQLDFRVRISPQCCLGGNGGPCYETSPTASLTFCSSSCKVFSVGNLWHFSHLPSEFRLMENRHEVQPWKLSPLKGLCVPVSTWKNISECIITIHIVPWHKQQLCTPNRTKVPLSQTLHFQGMRGNLHFQCYTLSLRKCI